MLTKYVIFPRKNYAFCTASFVHFRNCSTTIDHQQTATNLQQNTVLRNPMAHTEDIASRGWVTDFPGISLTGGQIADQMTAVPPLRGCHWVAKDSILLQMGCSLLRTGRTRSNNFETGWDRAQFVGNDRIAGNATPFTHRSMAQW